MSNFKELYGQKISAAKMGHEVSSEAREKIRRSRLGKALSAETRERLSTALKGRQLDSEHVERVRRAVKAAYERDPTYRQRVADGARGERSDKARAAMSRGQQRRYANHVPEHETLGVPATTYYRWVRNADPKLQAARDRVRLALQAPGVA